MIRADERNIEKWIDGMNQFNSTPEFGTTRILFTKPEIANRAYIKNEMEKIGLSVEEDAIGNIYATLRGSDSSLGSVWSGSHIDTVPNAGKFDGMAGVVCAMEAARMIKENNIEHKRDIKVLVFTSEEPTRYGLSCLGSRAMSDDLHLEDTKKLKDHDGNSLYDKLMELDYNIGDFEKIRKKEGEVYASVELHIEQNDRLEKAKIPIGIVRKICAPSNYTVKVTGVQSHAGGTDMYDRKDAYAGACEMFIELERLAKECDSEYNTATCGHVVLIPNAVNVIPGKCEFSVDIRDCQWDTKQKLIADFKRIFSEIADRRGLAIEIIEENNDRPLTCNENIINIIKSNCANNNFEYKELISGPYHDSLFVGRFTKAAMIFVPSKNGISHSPLEWTDYGDLAKGTEVLAATLLELSNRLESLEG